MAINGVRESEQSWHEPLVRVRDENGLVIDPELTTGDGALGLEGGQEGFAHRMDAALLGPEDGERVELPAEMSTEQGQGRSPRDLRSRKQGAAPMRRSIVSSRSTDLLL